MYAPLYIPWIVQCRAATVCTRATREKPGENFDPASPRLASPPPTFRFTSPGEYELHAHATSSSHHPLPPHRFHYFLSSSLGARLRFTIPFGLAEEEGETGRRQRAELLGLLSIRIKSIKYRGYRILNRVSIRENIEGNDDIWGEGEAIIHKGVITAMETKART